MIISRPIHVAENDNISFFFIAENYSWIQFDTTLLYLEHPFFFMPLPSTPHSTVCVLCYSKLLQPCPTLCDPVDCNPPGSSVHGVLQYWSGLRCPSPGNLPDLRIEPTFLTYPALQVGSLPLVPPRKHLFTPSNMCMFNSKNHYLPACVVVQLPSHVWLFANPWTVARQASLSLTISWSLSKFMSCY